MKITKSSWITGIFLLGFIFGICGAWGYEISVRKDLFFLKWLQYLDYEEGLAKTASEEGNLLESFVHRQNVVWAATPENKAALEVEFLNRYNHFFMPLIAPILRGIAEPKIAEGKNWQKQVGILRGKLAYSLDAIGRRKKAHAEWKKSKDLIGFKTVRKTQEFIKKME